MGTLENTVSMMKTLPETDLLKIQSLTTKLFQRHKSEAADEAISRHLKPMSREDIMKDLEIAEQEIVSGNYSSAEEVFDGLEHRYGLQRHID